MRNLPAAAQFADRFNSSDEIVDAARSIAADYGCRPVDPTTAHALATVTSLCQPAAALEVGTGTGVSTLSILRGMPASGFLTSIDSDSQRQAVASELIALDRIPLHRVRMITGRAEAVMTRLAPAGYELVFIDTEPAEHVRLVRLAYGLLAPGGVLMVNNTMDRGNVANPAARGPETRAARETLELIGELQMRQRVLLPVDSGFLIAQK